LQITEFFLGRLRVALILNHGEDICRSLEM